MTVWKQFTSHLRAHWIAIAFAVFVGLVSIAPSALAIRELGNDYRGVFPMFLDNEDYYYARVGDILTGNVLVGSPGFYEYKHTPPLIPPIGEYVYALPVFLTGIPQTTFFILSKGVFPALLFLLVYALAIRLGSREDDRTRALFGVATGLLVTLGFDLTNVGHVLSFFSGASPDISPSLWTRPVNPITGALFLFGYLHLALSVMQGKKWRVVAFGGVILGLMSGYVFSWGLAIAVTGVLFAIHLFHKNFGVAKRLAAMVLLGFAMLLPYVLVVMRSLPPGEANAAERNGLMLMHAPIWNKVLLAGLAMFLAVTFLWRRFRPAEKHIVREPWWMFSLSLLLGGVGVFTQQIVTGRTIWPYHFVQYTIPLTYVAVMALAQRTVPSLPRMKRAWPWMLGALCVLIMAYGYGIATSYRTRMERFRNMQSSAEISSWLNANADNDCVVHVDEPQGFLLLSRLIPTFTTCTVYASDWIFAGVIPSERIRHDYFVFLRMSGVTGEDVETYLRENPTDMRTYFFDNFKHIFFPDLDREWFERSVASVRDGYREFLKKDFSGELRAYKLDYVLVRRENAERIKTLLPQLRPVAEFEQHVLYAF